AFAPRGLRFISANGAVVGVDPTQQTDAVILTFRRSNWNVPQIIEFAADTSVAIAGAGSGFITHTVSVETVLARGTVSGTVAAGATSFTASVQGGGSLPGGLGGMVVAIVRGKGAGQKRFIASSTSNSITVTQGWQQGLDSTSEFKVTRITQGVS